MCLGHVDFRLFRLSRVRYPTTVLSLSSRALSVPHAETFNPKLVARTVGEPEFQDAWENLRRLWRGLDDHAMSEFRELLKRYMQGELTMSEWRDIVHSITDWRGLS